MSAIADIVEAFQDVNRGIVGVKAAPKSDQVPEQLTSLPAAITWYAGDEWTKFGNAYFEVEVYVAEVGKVNPRQAMSQCLALASAFRTAYRALHKVGGVPIAREPGRGGFGSSGVNRTLGFSGKEYFGFVVRVPLMGVEI